MKRATKKPTRRKVTATVVRKSAELAELRARKALATYKIAEINRFTRDWRSRRRSADAAVIPDAPITQGRVRQLVRDDAYAASAVRAFVRNVVGRGVQITATKKLADGSPDSAWKAAVSEYWDRWSNDQTLVDRERRRTLHMVLCWAIREFVVVGEAFIVHGVNAARSIDTPGVVLQCIEAEQLDESLTSHTETVDGVEITRQVRGGVEVDGDGAAVAYHFTTGQQDTLTQEKRETKRLPAHRVIHFFEPERAAQTRGFTRFSSVGARLRHLSEYDSNQLIAARAEACIGFITKMAQAAAPFGVPTDAEDSESSSESEDTALEAQTNSELNPLMIARLGEGEDVVPFTPTRPGNLYEPFVRAQLRANAAGLGVSYEQIARDFTQGTYSSQRQSMLEDRREFRQIQDLLVSLVVRPIRRLVIEDGIARGLLAADGYTMARESWLAARYMPDGWQWIDPEKEANGAAAAIAAGLSTREIQCGERALDWELVNEQLSIEETARETAGLAATDESATQPALPEAPSVPTAPNAMSNERRDALVELLTKASSGVLSVATATATARLAFPDIDPAGIDAIFATVKPRPAAPQPSAARNGIAEFSAALASMRAARAN